MTDAEKIASAFHAAYEALAPTAGYETRKESAVPWADVPENNRTVRRMGFDLRKRPDRMDAVTAPTSTFLDDYLAGRAEADTIDDHIDVWHNDANPFGPKLHEHLGMTWEQYKAWGERGELPAREVTT